MTIRPLDCRGFERKNGRQPDRHEIILPFVLVYRLVRKQIDLQIFWWLLKTWWPLKKYRRLKMRLRVWRARRYTGTDEFHRSLNMDVVSMLEMTTDEQEAYLADLMRRRDRLHDLSLGRPGPMEYPMPSKAPISDYEGTKRQLREVSPDMAILIREAQAGGATRSGNVIVPPDLQDWAREVLQKATPDEMKALDDAIQANFR